MLSMNGKCFNPFKPLTVRHEVSKGNGGFFNNLLGQNQTQQILY